MPTVILLSSSPPQVFARSPTPVDNSSPCHTSTEASKVETPSRSRFKAANASRDGFSGSFTSARQALADRNIDLNETLSSSPGRKRFKAAESINKKDDLTTEFVTAQPHIRLQQLPAGTELRNTSSSRQLMAEEEKSNNTDGSLIVQRAVSRRTDWTPPKPTSARDAPDSLLQNEPIFPVGLLGDFEYKTAVEETRSCVAGLEGTKRRKIRLPTKQSKSTTTTMSAGQIDAEIKASTKRSRSPTKKPLTITGLATANFVGHNRQEASPLLDYLIPTQNNCVDDVANEGQFATKVGRTKAAVAKIRESKKGRTKSRLVSPSTALKYFDDQEAIFGTASQLVQEHTNTRPSSGKSTSLNILSDLPSSPMHSTVMSADLLASPRAGTTRFQKSRNLWDAAGRDEDNALLHIDTIDLTDSPTMQSAFAGNDVMINQIMKLTKSKSTAYSSTHPTLQQKRASIFNIDKTLTLHQKTFQVNPFHTNGLDSSPRKRASVGSIIETDLSKPLDTESHVSKPKKAPPKKPHYAGLSDHDLKKQITAYGFKSVRKREKMIELLEKCWSEKHGCKRSVTESVAEQPGYGDILSHIHDVSARPQPKTKKVFKPRKTKEDTDKPTPAKKPRQRKPKEAVETTAATAPKTTRKRKPKINALPDARIYDIEDLDDPLVRERRELGRFDDWAKPPKPPKLTDIGAKHNDLPSPPSTRLVQVAEPVIEIDEILSQSQTTDLEEQANELQDKQLATPDDNQQSDIFNQITKAVNHESFTSNVQIISPTKSTSSTATPIGRRNHQTNPTWHEKILMYDPIVLEELATWLNTKGLDAIGEDRQVSALDVRTWCEARGICCLWKGGWRGQKGGD